ncbi:MAG: hypothetical protein DRZ82_09525 [Thermoprotei archaeon]|nr:MAG: hypothetical protein DRZ82_09525 [Thermoprotei archaeon]
MITREYFPERKIVTVSMEISGRDIEHVLQMLTFLSRHGIKIFSSILQAHPDRNSLHLTTFLDLTESDLTPAELFMIVRRAPLIKRLEVINLPLTHGEARLVVFTLEHMNNLFNMLRELGSGGLAIMYHMGFEAGKAMAEKLGSYFNDNERALRYILLYFESLGHGRFSIEEYEEGRYCRIIARELIECMGVRSTKPNSQVCRGILAGAISNLWNKDVEITETKCIAKGDPYCEFVIRAK